MKEKFQESLQTKIHELMEEIQEMEQQAHNIQLVHLDQMNKQEEKHHANITKLNQENADLRTRAEKREKEWLQEREGIEARNRANLQKQGEDFARLDQSYREDIAAEQDRHRRQLAEIQQKHAAAFEKQERDFISMLNSLTEKHRLDLAAALQ